MVDPLHEHIQKMIETPVHKALLTVQPFVPLETAQDQPGAGVFGGMGLCVLFRFFPPSREDQRFGKKVERVVPERRIRSPLGHGVTPLFHVREDPAFFFAVHCPGNMVFRGRDFIGKAQIGGMGRGSLFEFRETLRHFAGDLPGSVGAEFFDQSFRFLVLFVQSEQLIRRDAEDPAQRGDEA